VYALFVIGALAVVGGAIALEWRWTRRTKAARGYDLRDSLASAEMGALKATVSAGMKLASLPFFAFVYEHRVADIDPSRAWWAWLVLLVAEDFCYYAFHRTHHAVRLLWAAHVNHHSSRYFNLSTGLRHTLLTPFTSPLFWAPLALVGFSPWMILVAQGWSQVYQLWLHTEAVDRLGPLEWIFNTPSHHRVHHGKNARYLDRNHGGIFIIWDRLFGTFEPEGERVIYGLTTDVEPRTLWNLITHELRAIARDERAATTTSAKLAAVFGSPTRAADIAAAALPSAVERAPRELVAGPR
jgi:sterol desaturase/sphingolipid hydroxylase (fatty acid hydroxylase superfamily)